MFLKFWAMVEDYAILGAAAAMAAAQWWTQEGGGGVLSRAVLGGWGQVETEQLGSGDSMAGVERWEVWWAGGGGEGGGGVTAAAVISSTWPFVTPTVHCLYGWWRPPLPL